jgi:hypothetical protein
MSLYRIKPINWRTTRRYQGPWLAETPFGAVRIEKIAAPVRSDCRFAIISGAKLWNRLYRDRGPFASLKAAQVAVQERFEAALCDFLVELDIPAPSAPLASSASTPQAAFYSA